MTLSYIERDDLQRTVDILLDGKIVGSARYEIAQYRDGVDTPIWRVKVDIGKWHYRSDAMIAATVDDLLYHLRLHLDRATPKLKGV